MELKGLLIRLFHLLREIKKSILIKSDIVKLKINNIDINWIDAKNFYGANTNHIKKSVEKQTEKYINSYGTGAIIFKNGFNEELEKISDKLVDEYDQETLKKMQTFLKIIIMQCFRINMNTAAQM